jgi:hypothetical protein
MTPLDQHCREINRCNQRGGRMLSVADLLAAGTLPKDLAVYLLAAIGRGASYMVGALPGGAGKTTVMGALLNFIPPDVELHPADSLPTMEWALKFSQRRTCFICHEVSSGLYYSYLWGEPLQTYFELARRGHMLATNLHANTIEEARRQICEENHVSLMLFRKMNLVLFMEVAGGWGGKREVSQVWESDGSTEHRAVFQAGKLSLKSSRLVSSAAFDAARQILEHLMASGARDIQDVRKELLKPITITPPQPEEKAEETEPQTEENSPPA